MIFPFGVQFHAEKQLCIWRPRGTLNEKEVSDVVAALGQLEAQFGAEHWVITYQPTHAILTVAPGNVPIVSVPDQGPTFLLLTLSLLGLLMYQRGRTGAVC